MTQHDDQRVPYQHLVDHFDRPIESPGEQFDPDSLPEGKARELYDTVMAEYYSRIPAYPAKLVTEKSKFDLINRARHHRNAFAVQAQGDPSLPELLGTTESKQLSRQEIQQIVGAYRTSRLIKPVSPHP